MQYKNLSSTHPREVTRILRRLWRVKVFDGPPLDDTPVIEKTVVAMNQIEANRMAGGELATRPEFLSYVTWPALDNPGGPVYRINNPTDGPYGDPIEPSVPIPENEGWDF